MEVKPLHIYSNKIRLLIFFHSEITFFVMSGI
jgi:hypothetical protein